MSVSKSTNPVVREGQAEITSKSSAPNTDTTEPFRSNQLQTDSSPKSCTAARSFTAKREPEVRQEEPEMVLQPGRLK